MFFLSTEIGYILNFTTLESDHKNQEYANWFTLPLHEDAVDCLKTIGRLPPTTTREFIEAYSKAIKYEELLERKATTPEGVIMQERLTKLKAERVDEAKAQELIVKQKQDTIDEQKLEIA